MDRKKILDKRIILGSMIFCVIFLTSAQGQEVEQYLSPALTWEPNPEFSKYMEKVIGKRVPGIVRELNYLGVVSIVAIPTLHSPIKKKEQLEKGNIIGAIFLSAGSLRLRLPPGAYQVKVARIGGHWRALFLDGYNQIIGDVPAEVKRAKYVDKPFAYVDRSVCYRFDKVLVCY